MSKSQKPDYKANTGAAASQSEFALKPLDFDRRFIDDLMGPIVVPSVSTQTLPI